MGIDAPFKKVENGVVGFKERDVNIVGVRQQMKGGATALLVR